MASTEEQTYITHEDYLTGELASAVRHEYLAGQVFAMAGASEAHATVAGNLFALLRSHVRGGPCRVYIADMKVRVDTADAFYYPDVFVTCSAADAAETYAKREPALIVEVLSVSTAAFDRGEKFAHYRQLPSLSEYVLIDPERLSADVFRRNETGQWVLFPFDQGQTLELTSVGFSVDLDALYEDVDLT